jgi:hypothetical protein
MSPSRPGRPPFVVLRLLFASVLLVLAFASVVLVVALLSAWRTGAPSPTAGGALAGIICALVVLLFVTIFLFHRETIGLPLEERAAYLRRLTEHLTELGYKVRPETAGRLVARPAFQACLFGGPIVVRLGDERVALTGPRIYLEALRRRLRVHTHLEQLPHTLAALRHRHGGRLLKEVRVNLQVPGEQLTDIYREVSAVLAREGAELHCELSIRARGAHGLRDRVVETSIHAWLKEQQVPVQIDKEPLLPEAIPGRCVGHTVAVAG